MMENKFTPRAEESLRLAQEAAEEMGHGYVGSEHLLLGLMREEEGIAHRVLEEAGLTDDMIWHRPFRRGSLPGADPPGQERRGAGRVRSVPHRRGLYRHRASADGPAA